MFQIQQHPGMIVVAVVWAFSSGVFFGYLHVAKIVAKVEERRDEVRGIVRMPGASLDWEVKHPWRAVLMDLWMLSSAIGPLYCIAVLGLLLFAV